MRRDQTEKKSPQNSFNSLAQSQFQPRPFAVQAKAETPTQEVEKPELQSDDKKLQRAGINLMDIMMAANNASAPPNIQPKLEIGEVGDKYEQEADLVASQIVSQINQPIQKKLQRLPEAEVIQRREEFASRPKASRPFIKPFKIKSQDQNVQRQEAIAGGAASTDLESSIQSARGGGQSLDANLQQSMGQAMGADFSGVKVHTDSQSNQLNQSIQAKAFTTGQDVFFRQGAYKPSSRGGQELIAHELTHVVQQNSGALQRKPDQTAIGNPSAIQISHSSDSSIQRVLWHSDQFYAKLYSPHKSKILGESDLEYQCRLIHLELQVYESVFLNPKEKNKYEYTSILEMRSDRIGTILELVEEAKKYVKKDKDKQEFERFEYSLLEEKNSLEQMVQGQSINDVDLAIDSNHTYFEYQYTESVYNPIFKAVCNKLGLNRGEWRRSKALNQFRDSLKSAARSKAYQYVDTLIEAELELSGKESTTEASKAYYGNKSKVEAYTIAKVEVVNEVVKDVAREITEAYAVKEDVFERFEDVQSKSNPDKQKAAVQAEAQKIVKETVGKTSGENASPAIKTTRDITKGGAQEKRSQMLADVSNDTKGGEVAKKSIKNVLAAETLEQGFTKIASIIDFAVPTPGSSCEVDFQIKVPIPNTPGIYFMTQVLGSAEKDAEQEQGNPKKQEVKAVLEVTLGAGWQTLGVDLNAQIGFFFESKAESSQKAVGLVSYGFYRKLQSISPTASAKIWGSGGEKLEERNVGDRFKDGQKHLEQKGTGQTKLAESWGAMMEEWLFYEHDASGKIVMEADGSGGKKPKLNEDASVQLGGMVKGAAKVKTGVGEVEGKGQIRSGSEFSAKSIGKDALGKVNKTPEQLKKAIKGQPKKTAKISTSMDLSLMDEAFGCGLEVALTWLPNLPQGSPISFLDRILKLEVEGTGKVNTKLGGKSEDWQKWIASAGTSFASIIRTVYERANSDDTDDKNSSSNVKAGAGIATDAGNALTQHSQDAGASIVKAFGQKADETGEMVNIVDTKQALELAITYERERGEPAAKAWEQSLAVAVKRVREIGFDADVVAAKMESKNRLAGYKKKW